MSDNIVLQKSKEWFEKRKGRITGSRIGAILGLSPWQSRDDVLRAMVREYHGAESEFTENPATKWGTMHERHAMLAFMRETGLHVEEVGFIPYGNRMGASPDGLTDDGGVLELKVPFGLRNGGEFKTLDEQPHYYAQVQMEMLAADRNHAYFAQYIVKDDKISIDRVERDPEWINKVLPSISDFYDLYISELNNPEHLAPLRIDVEGSDAIDLVSDIMAIREQMKELKEKEQGLLNLLIDIADGKNTQIGDHKLTKVKDSQTIAYAKAVKDLLPGADLTAYTSVRKGGWRLS